MTGRPGFRLAVAIAALALAGCTAASAETREAARTFKLDNGLELIVVADHRAPVVTHMIGYRVGAADEPRGTSGIAHFLEHLMFKSTGTLASGEFSRIISRLGGQDNAVTNHDMTLYYQRVPKEGLRRLMELEADRRVDLRLTEEEVLVERDVIVEERRQRVDSNPLGILSEQVSAALYQNHPYRIPVLGWAHEMSKLTRGDALAFYKRFYAPNNAFVVVVGDVDPDAVLALARETYGVNPRNPATDPHARPTEPEHLGARHLTVRDARVANATLLRMFHVPSYATARPGEAHALEVLVHVLAQGDTSRLTSRLVLEMGYAVGTDGGYSGLMRDSGQIALYVIAADGVELRRIEAAVDQVIADLVKNGITAEELERARSVLEARHIYDADNQLKLARRYADTIAAGLGAGDVGVWLERLERVTADDVKRAASLYLRPERSVTGYLLPDNSPPSSRSLPTTGPTAQN